MTNFITSKIIDTLLENGKNNQELNGAIDFKPVVKFFTPDGNCTWLLTELDAGTDIAFGLCDLGLGFPELGYVDMTDLASIRGSLGLPVERDRHFKADKTISAYTEEARIFSYIKS